MGEMTKRRRETRAKEIAQEVDPQAGGIFRRSLERAALLGMEFASPAADENAPKVATSLRREAMPEIYGPIMPELKS